MEFEPHQQLQQYVADLNRLYRQEPALYEADVESAGFEWIDFSDVEHSVIAFIRRANDPSDFIVIALNLTPVPREGYRLGVPQAGVYCELLNSDASIYGGSDLGNLNGVCAEPIPFHGQPYSLRLTLPPLAAVFLKLQRP